MKSFKFLNNNTKKGEDLVEFLLEYNRRLDYHYVCHHGIFTRYHRHNQESNDLYNRTNNFIRCGQLTSVTEVRRYVYLSYMSFTQVDYEISTENAMMILDETYDFLTPR